MQGSEVSLVFLLSCWGFFNLFLKTRISFTFFPLECSAATALRERVPGAGRQRGVQGALCPGGMRLSGAGMRGAMAVAEHGLASVTAPGGFPSPLCSPLKRPAALAIFGFISARASQAGGSAGSAVCQLLLISDCFLSPSQNPAPARQ